jgi:hypothetical protein
MVKAMPYSEFVQYFKCAKMLNAGERLQLIEATSFHAYKKEEREKIIRRLKIATDEFLGKVAKDFGAVASNLAKRMLNRG